MEVINYLDAETIGLVVQLFLDDLNELEGRRKGKGRQGDVDDFELAADLYKTELAAYAQEAADRALCQSISRAVRQDAAEIRASVAEEARAAADREMALALCLPEAAASAPRLPPPKLAVLDDVLEAELRALNLFDGERDEVERGVDSGNRGIDDDDNDDNDSQDGPESSAWAAGRKQAKAAGGKPCVACGDPVPLPDSVRAPCGHVYCQTCVSYLVRTSLTDESLFPPRCCGQALPFAYDERGSGFSGEGGICIAGNLYLSPMLSVQFVAKKEEYGTADRTYCHQPVCSAFLSPARDISGDTGTCLDCGSTTCVICKGAAPHAGDCPADPAAQEVLRMAQENGWQRCRACKRLVELNIGCNHMTCLCGAQFCYVCGERWKTCECPQWNEDRLLARAEAVVDRDAQILLPQQRRNWVQREARHLEENHECEHRIWRSRKGEFDCEECYDTMPRFIYECRQCRILACRRCRFNRL